MSKAVLLRLRSAAPAPPPTTAPKHLRPETREWWEQLAPSLKEHQRRMLTLAGESWDLNQAANIVLNKKGMTYRDRFGQPKSRPETAIARDAKIAFLRALRELALDVLPPGESRPKSIRSVAT